MTLAGAHLEFDRSNHLLLSVASSGDAEIVRLTPLEHRLVEYMFTRNRNSQDGPVVCRYDELTAVVWPDRGSDDARAALSGLVSDLRKKIEVDASMPRLLTTKPGEGYALAVEPFTAIRTDSPFIVGPPVIEPARFFGRVREIERLFKLWMRRPLHSAVVIGPPRSGKTSLLYHLKALPRTSPADLRPGQRTSPRPLSTVAGGTVMPDTFRMAFINFQDPRAQQSAYVIGEILRACGIAGPEPCREDEFVTIISSQLDSPAIVLLDEADSGLNRPALAGLWATLRSAASHHPRQLLAFVVACHAVPMGEPTYGSPFMNIIGELIELGPFTRQEAEDLVASSPRPFPADDVEWMLEHSGCWPALLQMFCDTRLNALETGSGTDAWREHALRRAQRLRHLMPA